MKKICFVVTVEFAVKAFLLNHLRALSNIYDVTVVVNTKNPHFLDEHGISAQVISLPIMRDIDLFNDLACLLKLLKIFYQQRFDSVHSITPKAGLLAMLAAWCVRVPLRIHTFQGEVWVTRKGLIKWLLRTIDKLIARLSNNNLVVSQSERQFLIDNHIIASNNSQVFCNGSISGVNLEKFKLDSVTRKEIRSYLEIDDDTIIFLFMGRLTRDKGVLDLASAFSQLQNSKAFLLFVGPDEQNVQNEIVKKTESCRQFVHFVGNTNTPENYMAASDVLCLPSYREGFGSVVIEAAAVGIPTVASRIYGVCDAVVEGVTGLLHEPRAVNEIEDCMESMLSNRALRLKLGKQAQTRAVKDFDSQLITQAWVNFYHENV